MATRLLQFDEILRCMNEISPSCSNPSWSVGYDFSSVCCMDFLFFILVPHKVMYVCMYRGRPFVEMPMGMGVPTGPRGGTHRDRGSNIPTPRYKRHRVSHAGSYLRTDVRFLNQLYFGQLRVSHSLMWEAE